MRSRSLRFGTLQELYQQKAAITVGIIVTKYLVITNFSNLVVLVFYCISSIMATFGWVSTLCGISN
jgi:hypothetical protein